MSITLSSMLSVVLKFCEPADARLPSLKSKRKWRIYVFKVFGECSSRCFCGTLVIEWVVVIVMILVVTMKTVTDPGEANNGASDQ
jgi:hypothetical protein